MIEFQVVCFIAVVLIVSLLTMLSEIIKVAYPILLVVAGLLLSFIPSVPKIELEPELVFILFLPPLLYEAAAANSWKALWRWRNMITLFAFGVVFITSCAVALLANHIIPGFSIALGFLLGGIVSPPDAVSAGAIMKFVKVPRNLATVLEGESLFNDASSLIVMKFALIAIGTGEFIVGEAALSFVWMIFGGAGIGLLLAYGIRMMHQHLPTSANIDIVLSLITPYVLYMAAEEAGASGVIATVSGGLYISQHNVLFMDSSSRLRGSNVWASFTFLLNGFVFLLIGLDLPEIVEGIRADGGSLAEATVYGLAFSALLILVRMAVAYGAAWTHRLTCCRRPGGEHHFLGKGTPFILGWSGMRGVVSLAAALSVPLTVGDGWPFPQRSMIIYITFIVILVTLILQGLTLPLFIRRTRFPNFHDYLPEEEAERIIRQGLAKTSLDYLHEHPTQSADESRVLQGMVAHWSEQLETEDAQPLFGPVRDTYTEILRQQRLYLWHLNRDNPQIDEETIRHFSNRIDIEEERLKSE